MSDDEKWMRRALTLARRGKGHVDPNPLVGAVLVRNGRVVSEGYHQRFGGAHAEVEALRRAKRRRGHGARESTLYVNLEPCAHWGKTPPCADAIIRAGITRVVAAMKDPNPLVSGKGLARLRKNGISIHLGVLKQAARRLNQDFVARMKGPLPRVILKVAASLDGRTATVTGESKWITSAQSRKAGHRLRAAVDAVVVGANTVRKDNPSLTAHQGGRNPIRVIFAGRRGLPKRAKVFDGAAPTWVIQHTRGKRNLLRALRDLGRRGIRRLLVEGGPKLQSSFLEAGVVNEVVYFIAPLIIGNHKRLKDAWRLIGVHDVCLRGELRR
jgi:diaminohydroxyphosphoribosylaminopyrimidine deaminase/5-amino-6-(5-phosphoribosylamino)uracil reductase